MKAIYESFKRKQISIVLRPLPESFIRAVFLFFKPVLQHVTNRKYFPETAVTGI
jgi:hypothetical protein